MVGSRQKLDGDIDEGDLARIGQFDAGILPVSPGAEQLCSRRHSRAIRREAASRKDQCDERQRQYGECPAPVGSDLSFQLRAFELVGDRLEPAKVLSDRRKRPA